MLRLFVLLFVWRLQFVSSTTIQVYCFQRPSCYLDEPGRVKIVAIDNGVGLVQLNPENGGVVVATVKAGITVQEDERLLIYQSTKQIRIAGSGFEDAMKAGNSSAAIFVGACCQQDRHSLRQIAMWRSTTRHRRFQHGSSRPLAVKIRPQTISYKR